MRNSKLLMFFLSTVVVITLPLVLSSQVNNYLPLSIKENEKMIWQFIAFFLGIISFIFIQYLQSSLNDSSQKLVVVNPGNSLQEKIGSLFYQGRTDSGEEIIRTSLLKIVGNTVVFDNNVYQVRNICVAQLVDLSQLHPNKQARLREKYGLRISMNSGEKITLMSHSKEFVLTIILVLHEIMNTDAPKSVAFNFDTLHIQEKSITTVYSPFIERSSGSTYGDAVSNVG